MKWKVWLFGSARPRNNWILAEIKPKQSRNQGLSPFSYINAWIRQVLNRSSARSKCGSGEWTRKISSKLTGLCQNKLKKRSKKFRVRAERFGILVVIWHKLVGHESICLAAEASNFVHKRNRPIWNGKSGCLVQPDLEITQSSQKLSQNKAETRLWVHFPI